MLSKLVQIFLLTYFMTCCCGCPNNCNCSTSTPYIWMDCSGGQLDSVPPQLDKNLTTINLQWNRIEIILRSDFAGLYQLKILKLNSNRISQIEESSFLDLLQLSILFLGSNRLTLLTPEHFVGLGNLQALFLNDNVELTIDPCLFSQIPSVRHLFLENTRIDFNDTFVVASNACLHQYPTALTESSPTFPYVMNLQTLSIEYQGTSSDLTLLEHFTKLNDLSLFSFPVTSFQNTDLSNFGSLKIITLVAIEDYPVDFLNSVSVTTLAIGKSTFSRLPKNAFLNLPSLTDLYMYDNSLTMIDKDAFNGTRNLTHVDLSNNSLVSLPQGVFDNLGNATYFPYLYLDGNQWHCDCKIEWFQTFSPFEDFQLSCETPIDLAGMSLFSISLDCDPESGTTLQSETDYYTPSTHSSMMTSGPRIASEKTVLSSTQTAPSMLLPVLAGGVGFIVGLLTVVLIIVFWIKCRRNQQAATSPPTYVTPTDPMELGITHTYLQNIRDASNDNENDHQRESGHATSIQDIFVEKPNMYERSIVANDSQQTYGKSLPPTYLEVF